MSFRLDRAYRDLMCILRSAMHQSYWIIINSIMSYYASTRACDETVLRQPYKEDT